MSNPLSVSPRGEDGRLMADVRSKMGNSHVDSVERNGAGIFRVLN